MILIKYQILDERMVQEIYIWYFCCMFFNFGDTLFNFRLILFLFLGIMKSMEKLCRKEKE